MSGKIESLKHLKLSQNQISQEPQNLLKYGNDWLKQWKGKASLVLFPKSAQDLQNIVQWARQYKYKLVPSGGRTGLSGGATALQKEVVVSFDKMNRLLDFNPWDRTVTVEAGFITQNLQEFAKEKGLYFPVSFASQGSSQIGGNIATNAGGTHVLKYGNIKRYVAGLEVVTGCGEILKLGKALIKNAVGYHLKDLFIGSEGTLAFISQATLSLVSPPNNPQVFLIALENKDHLLEALKEFRNEISPLAFEFWTDKALKYAVSHGCV
ncbi:MAG: FAD-binding oxidoreductase, partial [Oligoflexia bacterium]|nr:FAD-binding oxidoreductase [Oligoflexia bacterium]